MVSTGDVVQRAIAHHVELVRFLYVDNGGIIRGKASSSTRLAQHMRNGIGLTVAAQALTMLDELPSIPGLGPVGEIRLVPDPSTFTALPYAPGSAAMVADMVDLDGTPWAVCPRTFLKQAIAEAAGEGYAILAAFEPEHTLGRKVDGDPPRLEPIDQSLCFSTTGFGLANDYAVALARALAAQGLTVEQYYPELGHGQQELTISAAPALRAADNQVLYRETAKGVAWSMGLWSTFAPKPMPDQIGNGCHVHLSVWELGPNGEPHGRNLLHDAHGALGLSDFAHHVIGGLLAHMPGLVALTAGSVNSYRRLQPQSWASAYLCWGPDNREASLRVASPMWADPAASINLELKSSDATGNPYLALGGAILAALDGIRRKLDPGAPLDVDPSSLGDAALRKRGIKRLPASLGEALDALEADEVLREGLGKRRTEAYVAVKRSEAATFASHDIAFECGQHFMKF